MIDSAAISVCDSVTAASLMKSRSVDGMSLPTLPGAGGIGGGGGAVGGVSVINSNNVNLPAAGIGGFNPGSFNLTLFNSALTRLINLELNALEADGRGKIISSPRVVTADKVKAVIEQGTEIPYQQSTSSGATSVCVSQGGVEA